MRVSLQYQTIKQLTMEATQDMKNVRAAIRQMELRQTLSFPLERYEYIQSLRTRLKNAYGQKYTTRIDREEGVVHIERIL